MKKLSTMLLMKIFKIFIVCVLVLNTIVVPVYVNAETVTRNETINISITIEEKNNVSVKDYFFRRGVAVEKGVLYSVDDLCLTENGEKIISDAEITQKYDDGSIHWFLISGKVDLDAGEKKDLLITNGGDFSSALTEYTRNDDNSILVDGEKIDFKVTENGISSLSYMGEEQILDNAINLYVTIDNSTYMMTADNVDVIKHTDSYIKIKSTGKLCDDVKGEIYITLAEGASKIQIDHRITAENQTKVQSTGLYLSVHNEENIGTIIDADYLDLGKIKLVSLDNSRFNGATTDKEKTGYVIVENGILFAPIVNNTEYLYHDGVSRTAHLYIGFDENAKNWVKTLNNNPSVSVDCEQYVRAGEILTTDTGALVDSMIDTFKTQWREEKGIFTVGGMGTVMPGEIEYNFGCAYMQTGDEELFRRIYDAAELRADVYVYRGMHEDCYGVMRATGVPTGTSFFQSHGYYSDEAGLYMAYLLSGDEYFYDTYKLCIEKTLKDMSEREVLEGASTPVYWYWGTSENEQLSEPWKADMYESRGMIRARTLYLASQFFDNESYKEAAYKLIKWAKQAQLPSGGYSQVLTDRGTYAYQVDRISGETQEQLPVKDYIMLMGARGISEILDWEDNEEALDITLKVADYLCSQGENFGTILMNPNSDKTVYEVNEDRTRTAMTHTNVMAVDVLCTAFENTYDAEKKDRYLTWILKFLDSYIASSVGGLGGGMGIQGYTGTERGWSADTVRDTSLLKTSDNLNVILKENEEVIVEKGFGHLSMIFDENAKYMGEDVFTPESSFPAGIYNAYELDETKVAYMFNQYMSFADDSESWDQTLRAEIPGNKLWRNCRNVVSNIKNISLEKFLKTHEHVAAVQLPIYVENIQGSADITVNKYDSDGINIKLSGDFEIELIVDKGEFCIEEIGYAINVTGDRKTGTTVSINKGGEYYPSDGKLSFKVNGKGEMIYAIKSAFIETFEEYSIENGIIGNNEFTLKNGVILAESKNNKYAQLEKTNEVQSRLLLDMHEQPGEMFIITLDFMIPTGGSRDAELFGVQWWKGKGWGAHLRIKDRNLYSGYSDYSNRNKLVMSNLEENKWYNAFVFVDCRKETPMYKFYVGTSASDRDSFEYSKAQAEKLIKNEERDRKVIVSRIISVSEREGNPVCVDNIAVYTLKYPSVETALYRIKSMLKNEKKGNNVGEIPQKAHDLLLLKANSISSEIEEKELTDKQVSSYALELDNAINTFINSRVTNTNISSDDSSGLASWEKSPNKVDNKNSYDANESNKEKNNDTVIEVLFDDIDDKHWAYSAIMYLNEKEIMIGDENKIRPDAPVTRGEFTKIIVEAFELESNVYGNNFDDGNDKWWSKYAQIAADNGIVNGISHRTFGGDEPITREMICVIIERILKLKKLEIMDVKEASSFLDGNEISEYAIDAVKNLNIKGIVSGIGGECFVPKMHVTRAQAAQIVFNVLRHM